LTQPSENPAPPQDQDASAQSPAQPPQQAAAPDDQRFVNVKAASTAPRSLPIPTSRKILIALALPVLTALVIVFIYMQQQKNVVEYKDDLLNVGDTFIKLLADGNIGQAYDMLHPDTQNAVAAESLETDYRKATSEIGAFESRGSHTWGSAPKGEAPTSYTALFIYKNGKMDATLNFRAVRQGSKDAPLEYMITQYSFKRNLD